MNQLKLVPFSEKNAELVLSWRNREYIRRNMIDDTIISLPAHLSFVKNLKNDKSRKYYVVTLNDIPVGSLSFLGADTPNILWGCYIGETSVMPGLFLAMVVVAGDMAFNQFKCSTLISEVAETNSQPHRTNRFMGLEPKGCYAKEQKSGNIFNLVRYEIERDQWGKARSRILAALPTSAKQAANNFIMEQ